MTGPDAYTEDESQRDGAFSYAAEWHAFAIGVYDGLKKLPRTKGNRDVKKEPHYYRGGYVIGRILQVVLAGGVASKALGLW